MYSLIVIAKLNERRSARPRLEPLAVAVGSVVHHHCWRPELGRALRARRRRDGLGASRLRGRLPVGGESSRASCRLRSMPSGEKE